MDFGGIIRGMISLGVTTALMIFSLALVFVTPNFTQGDLTPRRHPSAGFFYAAYRIETAIRNCARLAVYAGRIHFFSSQRGGWNKYASPSNAKIDGAEIRGRGFDRAPSRSRGVSRSEMRGAKTVGFTSRVREAVS